MKTINNLIPLSILFTLLYSENSYAQLNKEEEASCFEFSFSANYLPYRFKKTEWVQENVNYNDSLSALSISSDIGCGLGLLKNFEVMSGSIIRTGIQAQFFNNNVRYNLLNGEHNLALKSISASIPLSFIYLFNATAKKPEVIKPYILVGGRYSATFLKSTEASAIFTYQPHDVMADIGIGMHLYGKHKHLLALEFIYSKGFLNMKNSTTVKSDVFNGTIKNMFRQTFMFSINLS